MKKILLADDHADSREIFKAFLDFMGYEVVEAENGERTLEKVRMDRPDLLLLNLHMPEISGHEVLQSLRDDPETEDLPCLVLTGDARYEQMGRALAGGADFYMTKPAEPREVGEAVATLLGDGPPDPPGSALSSGDAGDT